MSRPRRPRRINCDPAADYFKPRGIPLRLLEEVILELDELEAIRLADGEGLYQEQAARQMGVSRQTFGNTLDAAHRKLAEVLLHGKALRIARPPDPAQGAFQHGAGAVARAHTNLESTP